jgi:NAD(P)-dependent dehydrogenase (short-subunit alcohol dehydrogenase family)
MPVAYDFSGRRAIVTGGARGIGAAIAAALREAGADVWTWDLLAVDGPRSRKVDVTDPAQIGAAVAALLAETDGVDILVNNAGFSLPAQPVTQMSSADWRRVVDVNLTSVFEVSRQVVPLMQKTGYGRIVSLASLAGKEGTPGLSAYSAAKAGVIAFTKSLGKELAGTDIRVNCIAPAAVETDLLDQMGADAVRIMIEKSPLKRLGRVDEAVAILLWLCSEDCSFNTGAVFDLSGGRATY